MVMGPGVPDAEFVDCADELTSVVMMLCVYGLCHREVHA